MENVKTIKLYNNEVEIYFHEDSHRYYHLSPTLKKKDGTPKKVACPGTTSIIGACIDKSTPLLIWQAGVIIDFLKENPKRLKEDTDEILEEAKTKANEEKDESADIGKAIHKWVEDFINKEKPEMPENEFVLQGVNAFLTWKDENDVEFTSSEKFVYNRELGVCGIVDITAKVNGINSLLDEKTGNAIYESALVQTANYTKSHNDEAEEEDQIEQRIVLRISKETKKEYEAKIEKKQQKAIANGKKPYNYPEYKLFEAVNLDIDENGQLTKENQKKDYEAFERMYHNYRWLAEAKARLLK